jgi:drug/metabolite transporter (DMT)-like permease
VHGEGEIAGLVDAALLDEPPRPGLLVGIAAALIGIRLATTNGRNPSHG